MIPGCTIVSEVEDCDVLQSDLNTIYKWAGANNKAFNSNEFKYICFTPSESVSHSNVYLCSKMNLIDKVENIKDLGITMSSNCNFNQHINNVYKQCSRLLGWILRTFISRDTLSYNSFRWKAVRLFNCLPQHVRNVSSCSTIIFKKKIDQFLCNLDDKPCTPHFDNSVVHVTKCDTNFVSC